jgi:hypothetical protein
MPTIAIERQVIAATERELGYSLGVCVPSGLSAEETERHGGAFSYWLQRAEYHREKLVRKDAKLAAYCGYV